MKYLFQPAALLGALSALLSVSASAQDNAYPTPTPTPTTAAITYIQGNSAVPQTPQATVAVTYTAPQSGGDLNVVIVGWNDTSAQVNSVSDSNGNSYQLAVGPTVETGLLSQAIYYAQNINAAAPGANVVTVTFNAPANYPDIRILEYSGIDLIDPVDGSVGAAGNTATSGTGALTTANANDLLVAGNVVQTLTTGPGSAVPQKGSSLAYKITRISLVPQTRPPRSRGSAPLPKNLKTA
jgi:hypothetical protein